MRATSLNHLTTTAVLAAAATSGNAIKPAFRGRLNSEVDAVLSSEAPPRRVLHSDNTNQQREQKERRQEEQGASSYWWLNKQSSEKDIVYKSEELGQGADSSASNGRDSFSVFTISIDNNPDTSGLPYRAPSKKPTEKPTPAPTETITEITTLESIVQLVSPPDVPDMTSYTKQLDDTYYYPIWTNTFKGCTSSSSAPEIYNAFADEYLFASLTACCLAWFDSEDCSAGDSLVAMSTFGESENLDEYMFRMNGAEAYSDGGDSSEDFGSQDGPG